MLNMLKWTAETNLFNIVRIKNRFARKNKEARETAGYRDLQVVARIPPEGVLLELQFHLEAIYDLKSKVADSQGENGQTGHERYVLFRQIIEEAEGLDRIFLDAGMEWREPGCSMCLAMNADRLQPGERCASTSRARQQSPIAKASRARILLSSPTWAAGATAFG